MTRPAWPPALEAKVIACKLLGHEQADPEDEWTYWQVCDKCNYAAAYRDNAVSNIGTPAIWCVQRKLSNGEYSWVKRA